MVWKGRKYKEPETTFIYALREPSGEVRYIGKADNPDERFGAHMDRAKYLRKATMAAHFCPSRKEVWLLRLLDAGQEPTLVILEECKFSEWREREEHWRDLYLVEGHRLTNRKRNRGKGKLNEDYYEKARKEAWRRYREEGRSWTWDSWEPPT